MKFSIIIPHFNDNHNLHKLLLSLQTQTFKDFEILVVDDNSKDLPLNQTSFKNYLLIKNHTNLGPATSRNIGISNSKGEVLVFIDSDCLAPPNWLEKIHQHFKIANLNILAGPAKINSTNHFSFLVSKLGYPAGANLGFEKMWPVLPNGSTHHLSSCNFAIKRTFMDRLNLKFNEKFPYAACEDVYFSNQIIKNDGIIFYSSEIFVFHKPIETLKQFFWWHFMRGRGAYYLMEQQNISSTQFFDRILSFISSLNATPGIGNKVIICFLFIVCIKAQIWGVTIETLKRNVFSRNNDFVKAH